MFQSFLLAIREGLEAALVVGVVSAQLVRTGRSRSVRLVLASALAAGTLAVLAGLALWRAFGSLHEDAAALFAGLTSLISAALICAMVLWLRSASRSSVEQAVDQRLTGASLCALVFALVLREGVELALFTVSVAAQGALGALAGALAGVSTACAAGWLLFRGTLKVDLRLFFKVTSVLLVVAGAGLFASGIGELQEAGALPSSAPLVDLSWLSPKDGVVASVLKGTVGLSLQPTAAVVASWSIYLTIMLSLVLHPVRFARRGCRRS